MKLADVTALVRPIDPRYATNLTISAVSIVVAAAGAIYRVVSGGAWLDAIFWGAGAALAVFLAWALSRELDPDYDLAAFAGAALALAGLIAFGQAALLPLFWLLLLLRVVNRTTGVPARWLDSLGVLGLAGWLAWQGAWPAALVTAFGFLADGLLHNPLRRHLVFAALALALAIAGAVVHAPVVDSVHITGDEHVPFDWAILGAVAALWIVVIYTTDRVVSRGDTTGQPLHAGRVQAAQGLALVTAFLWALQGEQTGVVALIPLWAALLGVGLLRVGALVVTGQGEREREAE